MSSPEKFVCNACGSEDVSSDAVVRWDSTKQKWEVTDVQDYTWCHKCDDEIIGEWKSLELKDVAIKAIKKESNDGV